MEVLLKPHLGEMGKPDGTIDIVEFFQDMIYVDGQFVGYWPKDKGAPLLLVRTVPEANFAALSASCAQQRGVDDLPLVNNSYAMLVAAAAQEAEAEDDD